MKRCGKCEETKSVALFGKSKRYADGMWPYCKACDCKRVAEYRAKNPDKVRATQSKSRAKNPERIAEVKKLYRKNNAEKCATARREAYAKNREVELAKASLYKKENRHVIRPLVAKRMAAKLKATPKWFDKAYADEMYRQAAELEELTGISWHVDHIVPLQSSLVCGLHWHGNMQVISGSQNQSKSNRYWPDMP